MKNESIWEKAIIETINENGGIANLQKIYQSVHQKIKYSPKIDFEHSVRGYLSRLKNSKKILTQNENGDYCFNSRNKSNRHENYEILNLIGYGLAKFDKQLIKQFGFTKKTDFYEFLISKNVAETSGTIKNRQDLFDYFFDNGRRGWWQKGDAYIHRKLLLDSLYGNESVESYANIIKLYLQQNFKVTEYKPIVKPITQSKFRQMQETGLEAELFFMNNYKLISPFERGSIEDARLYGDGYDFQLNFADESFCLAEIKGLRIDVGSVRFTEKEIIRAEEYKDHYFLVVVNNLIESPQFSVVENPIKNLKLKKQTRNQKPVIEFLSENIKWQPWKNDLNG